MSGRLLVATLLLCLAACAGVEDEQPEALAPVAVWPEPVGEVAPQRVPPDGSRAGLDVGIVVFDPGIPEDESTHSALDVFPRIRRAESLYLPVMLRQALIDSDAWGVVRVLPRPDQSSELLVTGRILHSDGLRLVIAVRAVDATGRVWLERDYHDATLESDYPVPVDGDPYADLYRQVSNDLLAVSRQLGRERLDAVATVARLRYAQGLSPEAFGSYLARDDSGVYRAVRLPAQGDPMLARIERVRNQEYLFIDTVDEQYFELQQAMNDTYNLWRQYAREQALYREQYRQRVAERGSQGRPGSFYALQRSYDAYKWTRIHEQDLDELAGGFNNEIQPTVMEAEGRVYRLGGSLDERYRSWREILRRIFALETGLPPSEDSPGDQASGAATVF